MNNLKDKNSTIVTFPFGRTIENAVVLSSFTKDSKNYIIVDRTPFHPISDSWPDQPADSGTLIIDDENYFITDAYSARLDENGRLVRDIHSYRGSEGIQSFIVHCVENLPHDLVGRDITLEVDLQKRKRLSAAHSACHLTAFSLNKCTNQFWRKDVRRDSLGNYDLDQLTNVSSKILEYGSVDEYRFGKSIRKKGLNIGEMTADIDELEKGMNEILESWVNSDLEIILSPSDCAIETSRHWKCRLEGGVALMACGGTHVSNTSDIGKIKVKVTRTEFGVCIETQVSDIQSSGDFYV